MPPVNDDFANAIALTGASGSATFSNVGATAETGEPANAEGHSVWFKVDVTTQKIVVVRTSATPLPDWDSYLAVYHGPNVASLTLVTAADDNDYQPGHVDPYGTSRVTFTANPGTTYYVQVSAWDDVSGPVERSDLQLAWTISDPPPSISSFTPTQGVVGTAVDITGSHFTGATQVKIGGRASPFTVVSDTEITATVVNGAAGRDSDVEVTTAGGTATLSGFTPLYPGPWVQPADRDTTGPFRLLGQFTTTTGDSPSAPYPYSGSLRSADWSNPTVETAAFFSTVFGSTTYHWTFQVVMLLIDMDVVLLDEFAGIKATLMAQVPPSSGETSDPDYVSTEFEATSGDYVGPITLKVEPQPLNPLSRAATPSIGATGAYWLDDIEAKTADHTNDMWASRVEVRPLTDGDWSIDPTTDPSNPIVVAANPFTLLDNAAVLDEALLDSDAELAVFSKGTKNGTALSNNAEYVTHGRDPIPAYTVTLDLTDLDGDRRIGFAICFDSQSASVVWTDPHTDSSATYNYGGDSARKDLQVDLTDDSGAIWIYRPPRYRLYYCRPLTLARPPLGHRQRRDGVATAGPPLAHFQGADGATRPLLAHRQNTP